MLTFELRTFNWPVKHECSYIFEYNLFVSIDNYYHYAETKHLYSKVSKWIMNSIEDPYDNAIWLYWESLTIYVGFVRREDAIMFKLKFPVFDKFNND